MIISFNDTKDTKLEVSPTDSSYRYRAIKGADSVTLYFSMETHIEIPVGASIEFQREVYTMYQLSNIKKLGTRKFEYTLLLESVAAQTRHYIIRNMVDRRLKFSLTETPRKHLQQLVDNLNKRDSGWEIGRCIDAPEKEIAYNHTSCMEALSQIADAFETEYEFQGKTISLWKIEYNKESSDDPTQTPLRLCYGRGKGFKPGVGRTLLSDSKPVGMLYVQGGDRNIDPSKYHSSTLLLPKNATIRYDGAHFENEQGFDPALAVTYRADADGVSLQRDTETTPAVEGSLDLSHIYPSWEGTVSRVEITPKGFCDFYDKDIPQNLDFSLPESRFHGESLTVIFQSGELAGKEFEIQQTEQRVTGYDHAKRCFQIVETLIDGEPMPKGIFVPAKGDTYALFGMALPTAYVEMASWKMFREAVKYLYENERQKFTFSGELDGIWAKNDWLNIGGRIVLGGYVFFSDAQFQPDPVQIRIVGIKEFLNNPHSPELELSNQVTGGSFTSQLHRVDQAEVTIEERHKEALQFTKHRFRDAQETITLLEQAMQTSFTRFSNSISPITAQSMLLLVGDQSLQFAFVKSPTSTTEVPHQVTYDKKSSSLQIPGGYLQHKTLGVQSSITATHTAADYQTWELPAHPSATMEDANKAYFLYAQVERTSTKGVFRLEEGALAFQTDTHYNLLVGIVNSEFQGERSFIALHGFTEIAPGRITTDRIVSADGETFFDLQQGTIAGRIRFQPGSEGLENIAEWSEKQAQIDSARQAATTATEAIEAMNDDSVFDPIEKQATRSLWEQINGIASLTEEGTSGSYQATIKLAAGIEKPHTQAFNLANNEPFMVQK